MRVRRSERVRPRREEIDRVGQNEGGVARDRAWAEELGDALLGLVAHPTVDGLARFIWFRREVQNVKTRSVIDSEQINVAVKEGSAPACPYRVDAF